MMNDLPVSAQKKQAVDALDVRARFIRRGTSFTAWAKRRGFSAVYAHAVILGKRSGPVANRIIAALKHELEIP